jgi:hypothetical protein
MKRFMMLVGVAVVAAAMYVAAAPGSQQAKGPTAKQFSALKKQVAGLNKTVKTLKANDAKVTTLADAEAAVISACDQVAVPINQFGDPDGSLSGTKQGYRYGKTDPTATTAQDFFATGLDVTDTTDAGALWITGGTDTSCSKLLNTSGLRHAAAKAGLKLSHSASHLPTFVAHQH